LASIVMKRDRTAWFEEIRHVLSCSEPSPNIFWVLFGIAVLLYTLGEARFASRYVWHDELYTYYIANAPSAEHFWEALKIDLNPPLSYLAVRGSLKLFGDNPYALRLPSMVAFLIGSFSLYKFLSFRLGREFGLLGMLALWTTPYLMIGSEARPYALVFGFWGLALLMWQRTLTQKPPGWSIPALFASVLGMMFSHMFSVFYVAPFLATEFYLWYRTRKVRLPIWLTLSIPYVVPFLYLSKARNYESGSIPQAFQASFHKILSFYFESLAGPSIALLIAVVLTLGLLPMGLRSASAAPRNLVSSEICLALVLALLPICQVIVLMRSHAGFFPRYALPVVFAYALVFVAFMARTTSGRPMLAIVGSCVLAIFVFQNTLLDGVLDAIHGRNPMVIHSRPLDPCATLKPDLPLVAASGLTFVEMDHYASAQTRSRLYYLTDRTFALKYAGATIFEGLRAAKQVLPIRSTVQPYSEFITHHDRFLVIGSIGYPEDWLLDRLVDVGANVNFIGVFPNAYKDWQVFEVSMRGSGEGETKSGADVAQMMPSVGANQR